MLKVNAARAAYGMNGSGVTVGIMSDSYNAFDPASNNGNPAATTPAVDISQDDLPGVGNPCGFTTPVNVLADCAAASGCIDEGRAMMQLVHDVAPGAAFAFARPVSETDMANQVTAMQAAGRTNLLR